MKNKKYEKIILKISLYAGMAFVVVELFMSLWSSSQAILMDAVFDAAELIVIGLSLFLTPLFISRSARKSPTAIPSLNRCLSLSKVLCSFPSP